MRRVLAVLLVPYARACFCYDKLNDPPTNTIKPTPEASPKQRNLKLNPFLFDGEYVNGL